MPPKCRDDQGFTLVEMMVAVLIMAVAFTPLAAVFWTGTRTAGAAAHRTSGFSVASREIESMRAVPYNQLGFYTDQSPAPWSTDTTVILGSCSSSCGITPLVTPTGTTSFGGVTYNITRYIYWQNATAVSPPTAASPATTTDVQAYKGVTVVVTWTGQGGARKVEQDSIIYPGGQGVYSGPAGATTTTSTTAALSAPGAPGTPVLWSTQPPPAPGVDGQEIDVSVPPSTSGGAAQSYYLQYSTDPTFQTGLGQVDYPITPNADVPVQGLAASTTYYFRAYATNSAGQSLFSGSLEAQTPAPSTTTTTSGSGSTTTTTTLPCAVGSFTISTSTAGKTYLDKSGDMTENIGLSVNVTGSCGSTATVESSAPGGTTDPGSPYLLSGPAAGGQWSATIASSGSGSWAVGTHNMTVYLNGTATSLTHGLLVCSWLPPGQRSSSPTQC